MKVFVTGGTGFVGRYVLNALREAGHRITALARPGSERKLPFIQGVRLVYGDVLDTQSFANAMKQAEAVIHLVGIIREFPGKGITFEKLHHQATCNVARAAKEKGVKRFIFMSANGADENGVSAYQTTKWRAEREIINSGMEWTIFRPSVIFGDSHGLMEFTSQLAKIISKAPVAPLFGAGRFELDPVAVEDVADVFVKALLEPSAVNRVFHLGGGRPAPFHEIIQTIGKALGKPRTGTINIPFQLIKPVAAMLGRFRAFPVTVDQLEMLKEGNVCPELEYRKVFGVEPVQFTYRNLKYLAENRE